MLGYMTKAKAKAHGFTHNGSYYGLPVWIGDPHGRCMVATKWAPLELVMSLFHCIEGACHSLRNTEPTFMFKVKEAI
jgi:hypothetical protein